MYNPIHVCIDKLHDPQPPTELLVEENASRVFHAFKEREDNLFSNAKSKAVMASAESGNALSLLREAHDPNALRSAGYDAQKQVAELIVVIEKKWSKGKRLRVLFLEGTELQKAMVRKYAVAWTPHTNINFDFVEQGPAEIRVAFKLGAGSWSTVGTDSYLVENQAEPTMNYGWFTPDTKEEEYRRTIVHEFGHAIGCGHEQSSPRFGFTWKKDVVYAWYRERAGWSKEKVDHNVFFRYPEQQVSASAYDSKSIMQYPIPPEFTVEGVSVGLNTQLSQVDIDWAKKNYLD